MNFKNPIINLSYGCICSEKVNGCTRGMFLFCLDFGAACSDIILAMATDTTNSKVAGVKAYLRQT
jgi:hypothetical protein